MPPFSDSRSPGPPCRTSSGGVRAEFLSRARGNFHRNIVSKHGVGFTSSYSARNSFLRVFEMINNRASPRVGVPPSLGERAWRRLQRRRFHRYQFIRFSRLFNQCFQRIGVIDAQGIPARNASLFFPLPSPPSPPPTVSRRRLSEEKENANECGSSRVTSSNLFRHSFDP